MWKLLTKDKKVAAGEKNFIEYVNTALSLWPKRDRGGAEDVLSSSSNHIVAVQFLISRDNVTDFLFFSKLVNPDSDPKRGLLSFW